ncbi:MAG: c-type cytochrome [Burkholderiales bacterium]|jgi:cytochrome c
MNTWTLSAVLLAGVASVHAQQHFPNIGRAATPAEVAKWDIDVRPDFKGLPKGEGSVAQGQDVWEAKCASCHGIFGESNEVFNPVVGGVGAEDVKTGRVAKLKDTSFPARTTFMKAPSLSTVWDYINRAMPWNAPKSLSTNEVYAVTAYMLNLSGIVEDNFVLNEKTIVQAQARMPNREGMTTKHALWPTPELGGVSKPDTANTACMKNCTTDVKVTSMLPDFARDAHGNLAEQNRLVGQQKGVRTVRTSATADKAVAPSPGPKPAVLGLLQSNNCLACHGMDNKVVGPGFKEVTAKHAGKTDYLINKILQGSAGVWGNIAMPAQNLKPADAKAIAEWLAGGQTP